jgi:hypothetical protein
MLQFDRNKYKVTQKNGKCVVAAMYSRQHCRTGTFSYRQPHHLVIMDQWNGQQCAVAIKIFYMFGFLQFLLGFSKVPFFCVTLYFNVVWEVTLYSVADTNGWEEPHSCIFWIKFPEDRVRKFHQNNYTYQSDYTVTTKTTVILEDVLHTQPEVFLFFLQKVSTILVKLFQMSVLCSKYY